MHARCDITEQLDFLFDNAGQSPYLSTLFFLSDTIIGSTFANYGIVHIVTLFCLHIEVLSLYYYYKAY